MEKEVTVKKEAEKEVEQAPEQKAVEKNTKKRKRKWRGSFGWQTGMVFCLLLGLLLFGAGIDTAWTTWHDSDLIEPFFCSYEESDMHAREVSEAFENIAKRAEALNGTEPGDFFPGNIDYVYCVKKKEEFGNKLYQNLSNQDKVSDANICTLAKLKMDHDDEQETTYYNDCYWWDLESEEVIIYKEYHESRAEVPKALLKAKTIAKIGICYSEEVMQEKETGWNNYRNFTYFMGILLLSGALLVLYTGTQLFLHGKIPRCFFSCFMEVPFLLLVSGAVGLYCCYERKFALFATRRHMEMLRTSAGQAQLFVDIAAGAFVLTVCFLFLLLGIFMLSVKGRKQDAKTDFVLEKFGKKIGGTCGFRSRFHKGWAVFLVFAKKLLEKARFTWSFLIGFFTGKSIHGTTVVEKERKRTLAAAVGSIVCILGMLISLQSLPDVGKRVWSNRISYLDTSVIGVFRICFYSFFVLLLVFIAAYLFGSIRNVAEYAKLARIIEEIYQGNYQRVSAEGFGIRKSSLYFSDAQKLGQIGSGFQKAVQDQLQAERLKIELLTNVSHDLKTPLTSIISYVELLDREEEMPAEARDYVLILKKKAERLRTIISEVFELAKTTSGEIKIEKKEIDFYRLVVQTMGDMQDRIDASGLVIRQKLAQDVLIFSDGERMYRVLQNLLDNALKYSMKGTRIYLELVSDGKVMAFTIKNIAGYEMNFEAGDATERFMRGDKNRTTEGSGLGLSIAQGFTIACGGEFAVVVDGDMFKAEIRFPVMERGVLEG